MKKNIVVIVTAIVLVCSAFAAVPFLVDNAAKAELGKMKKEAHPNEYANLANPLNPMNPLNTANTAAQNGQTQNLNADVVDVLVTQAIEAFKNELSMEIPLDYQPVSGSVGAVEADGSLTVVITFLPPNWDLATLTLGRQSVDMYTAKLTSVDINAKTGVISGLYYSKTHDTDENSLMIQNAIRMEESADRGSGRTNRDLQESGQNIEALENVAREFAATKGFTVTNREGYSTARNNVEFTFSDNSGRTITITVSQDGKVQGF
jgi:hypothetical protein